MRDVELYRQVLGLEAPWTVTRVELSVTEERVDVWAGHAARVRWPCPTCWAELPVYDHAAERAWQASRYVPVRDLPARAAPAGRLPGPWCAAGAPAVSRVPRALHTAV